MKKMLISMVAVLIWAPSVLGGDVPLSGETEACLDCHRTIHPGIVADWERSRMSKVTPAQALKKTELERRISVNTVPEAAGTWQRISRRWSTGWNSSSRIQSRPFLFSIKSEEIRYGNKDVDRYAEQGYCRRTCCYHTLPRSRVSGG